MLLPLVLLFLSLNRSSMYGFTKLDALLIKELALFVAPSEQARSCAVGTLNSSGLLLFLANSMAT